MSDENYPFVEVTIRTKMPLPDGTSEEEALEAARNVFRSESEDGDVELRFVDSDTEQVDDT